MTKEQLEKELAEARAEIAGLKDRPRCAECDARRWFPKPDPTPVYPLPMPQPWIYGR